MSKRFLKPTIDWKAFEKLVPPEQKSKYLAFKGKADAYLQRVNSNPPKPPPINWEEYKKTVPVKGLVDTLKGEYEKYEVPYPKDTLSASVDKQWQELEPQIKTYCESQQKIIDGACKELDRIDALPAISEITMEMLCDMYPEQAISPVSKPTFWPHTEDEQEGYVPPEMQAKK